MMMQNFFFVSNLGHEIVLWVLLFISVLGLAVGMERYFFLRSWARSLLEVISSIKNTIDKSQPNEIAQLPADLKPDPGVKLIHSYVKTQPSLLKHVFHNFILEKKTQFESRLNILATIGSNAPFIGLLGTIFGVMDAFHSLGLASESAAPIVMLGISKALFATAVGLIVAIPAIIAYNYLRRKTRTLLSQLDYIKSSLELYQESQKVNKPPAETNDDSKSSSPFDKRIV